MHAKHLGTLRSLIGIAVAQGNELFSSTRLPDLPANAQYLPHENRCFDWGANGWAVAEGKVAPTRYSHIILVNSSVRGPYLPAYWPVRHAVRPTCTVLAHAPEHAVPLRLAPRRNVHLLQYITGRWPGLLGSMAACCCCLFAARRKHGSSRAVTLCDPRPGCATPAGRRALERCADHTAERHGQAGGPDHQLRARLPRRRVCQGEAPERARPVLRDRHRPGTRRAPGCPPAVPEHGPC